MGCFSYICKTCKKGINSDSFTGESVKMWLLKDGKVVESMEGQYDSYGRVFRDESTMTTLVRLTVDGPFGEKMPELKPSIEWTKGWGEVCKLHFNDSHKDGIAAIHTKCFKGHIPRTISKDDPDQGWNAYDSTPENSIITLALKDLLMG